MALIDKQDALDAVEMNTDNIPLYTARKYVRGVLDIVRSRIKALEEADAVPVVRCEDCIYSYSITEDVLYRCELTGYCKNSNGFCNDGERMGGED